MLIPCSTFFVRGSLFVISRLVSSCEIFIFFHLTLYLDLIMFSLVLLFPLLSSLSLFCSSCPIYLVYGLFVKHNFVGDALMYSVSRT